MKCFLLLYKKYERLKNKLKKKVKRINMKRKILFEDLKVVKDILKFVRNTK